MKRPITSHLLSLFALATCLLSAGPASAQDHRMAKADADPTLTPWVPVRHLEFTPDDIEGGVTGPADEPITAIVRAAQPSLIELRSGFEAEIVKTMEDM